VTFTDAVARLEDGLRRELPGPDAQARLAPIPRSEWPAENGVQEGRNDVTVPARE
jgi:hypothetical protein